METTPPPGDMVWGRHAAEAVLHSERPVHRVWCTGELRFSTRFMEVLRETKASGVVVEEVSWARLAQLCGGAVHQGIVLQTAAASSVTLQDLLGRCDQSLEPTLLVAVDGITDPHNLGAIARSAEAFGGHGLVTPQRRNAGLTGSVAKVAAGALEHLPVARVVNLNRSLEQLKDAGYTIVGLAGEGGECVVDVPAGEPLVVVVGSEGTGLSHLTRQYCDQIVRIPLRGQTPNLNAAVACGVVLYEIARQRWLGDLHGSMPTPPMPKRQPPTADHSEPETDPSPNTAVAQPSQFPTADHREPETDPSPNTAVAQPDHLPTADHREPETDPSPNPAVAQPDQFPTADHSEPETDPSPNTAVAQPSQFPTADHSEPETDPSPNTAVAQPSQFPTADHSEPELDPSPNTAVAQPDQFPTADHSEPETDPSPNTAVAQPSQFPTADHSEPETDPSPNTAVAQPQQRAVVTPENSAPEPDEPLMVPTPAITPVAPDPDINWSSSTTDTDLRLAAHISL